MPIKIIDSVCINMPSFEIGKTLSMVMPENLLLPTSHTLVSSYPRVNQLQSIAMLNHQLCLYEHAEF
jgi:hypothetical protein